MTLVEIRLQNEMQSPGGGGEVLAGVSGEAEALTGISTALLAGGGRWSRMAGEMPRASMAGGVGGRVAGKRGGFGALHMVWLS